MARVSDLAIISFELLGVLGQVMCHADFMTCCYPEREGRWTSVRSEYAELQGPILASKTPYRHPLLSAGKSSSRIIALWAYRVLFDSCSTVTIITLLSMPWLPLPNDIEVFIQSVILGFLADSRC